jgi:hypothetical protein
MKKNSVVLSALLCGLFWTLTLSGQKQAKPMTNNDVVAMVKAGLPESIILSAIDAQDTNFDNSAAALVDLNKQGVTAKVMDAMIAASKKQRDSAPAATPTPAAGAPQGQQLVGQAPAANPASAAPQNQPNQPKGANASAPAQGGFFGRLSDVQNQVNGAVKQTQGTVQQGQTSVRQIQGTAQQTEKAVVPGTAGANQTRTAAPTTPAASPNGVAPTAQAKQSPQPVAAAPATATTPAAAAQQTRDQQVAARQKTANQMNACKQQATAIDPQMRSPESQKAYTTCVQSVIQANTPAATK